MKYGLKQLTCLMMGTALAASFLAACSGTGKTSDYDITKRTPLDENEIAYDAGEFETYFNYIELYDDKGNIYQIGDPYVLRHDGKYYLYSSLTGSMVTNGIPCWVSENLVDWEFAAWVYGDGTAGSGGDIAFTAYAPEVTYYRGYFYMCEAPNGQGHYILRASAPDGKFTVCSDNLGLGIDGSLYVDAEGELYLLSAVSGSAAQGTIYYTPLTIENGWVSAGFRRAIPVAALGGWTEGPGQFERGAYKYLTYTGNHVNAASYRVGYAYTTAQSLFDDLAAVEDNLILLNTGDDTPYTGGGYGSNDSFVPVTTYRGLGHSSNIYGPNLDSVYIVYHNAGRSDHLGVSGSSYNRRYNVTQLLTNGPTLTTNGLAIYDTPKPKGADYSAYGEDELMASGGRALSKEAASEVYTAEINVSLADGAARVVVSYQSAEEYTEIAVSGTELTVSRVLAGTRTTLGSAQIAESDNSDAMHTVKVVNGYASSQIWYDGVMELALATPVGGAGQVGAISYRSIGSVQFTNDAFGTGDFESVKNLTAEFPAYTYLKTENRGFSIRNAAPQADGVRQGEKERTKYAKDGTAATVLEAGDWVKYAVNAPAAGTYALNVTVSKASEGCIFEVIVDETHIYKMEISGASFGESEYLAVHAGTFEVGSAGVHSLKIRVYSGTLDMTAIATQQNAESVQAFTNDLTQSFAEGTLVIGTPSFTENGLETRSSDVRTLYYFGNKGVANYEISVDVTVRSGTAGIVLRTKNFSYTPPEFSSESHAFQGYYLQMSSTAVTLVKYNYSAQQLAIASPMVDGERAFASERTNTVTVRVMQNIISVSINGVEVFTVTDPDPFLDGYLGLYTEGSIANYRNLSYHEI